LLPCCQSPNTIINKLKDEIAIKLRDVSGPVADIQLLSALVNICVALRKAALIHTLEAKDLLVIKDEFEGALLELMNCPSMDVPENVTKVLKKRFTEDESEPEHVIRASTLCEGPLFLCVDNDLTKILSTAQIKTFVHSVFYSSLKKTMYVPVRNLQDIFRLRSGSTTSRFRPFVMFALECALMPLVCLSMVVFFAKAQSKEACAENITSQLAFLCVNYDKVTRMLILYLVGRVSYEVAEIKYTFWNQARSGEYGVATRLILQDIFHHIFSDKWNVLDAATMVALSMWVYEGCTGVRTLICAIISLCLGLLRFVSLSTGTGQLIIMIFAMIKDLMPFVYILLVSMFGFGLAFHCKFPNHERFGSFRETMVVLFDAAIGDHDFAMFDGDGIGEIMMVGYIVLLSLVLLNLVVARMSATHEKLNASALEVWSRSQALNAEEFLLLEDRKPLCMLPAPLNIVAFVIAVIFDWIPNAFRSGVFTYHFCYLLNQLRSKNSAIMYVLDYLAAWWDSLTYWFHDSVALTVYNLLETRLPGGPKKSKTKYKSKKFGGVPVSKIVERSTISYAGTFSDIAICVLTSPFHAIVEVYLARQALMDAPHASYFTLLSVLLLPVWVIVFCIMIILRAFGVEDKTILSRGKIDFKHNPSATKTLASDRPKYLYLCLCIIFAAALVLRVCCTKYIFLCLSTTNSVCFPFDWLQTVYHCVTFHLVIGILVFILNICRIESQRRVDTHPDICQLAMCWQVFTSRLLLYFTLAIYDLKFMQMVEYLELMSLAVWMAYSMIFHQLDRHSCVEENSAKTTGWTNLKGHTVEEIKVDGEENKVILEIKLIRASLESKGLTIFGTNTRPFVVIKYLRNRQPSFDEYVTGRTPLDTSYELEHDSDLLYSSTVTHNPRAPEFNQFFYFALRKNDLDIEFKVYDRIGDHVSYLCGARCDIREWIANRRYETPIELRDSMGRPLPDNLQISAKVKFAKNTDDHPQSAVSSRSKGRSPRVLDSNSSANSRKPESARMHTPTSVGRSSLAGFGRKSSSDFQTTHHSSAVGTDGKYWDGGTRGIGEDGPSSNRKMSTGSPGRSLSDIVPTAVRADSLCLIFFSSLSVTYYSCSLMKIGKKYSIS
jgi:hypothetical protein